MCTGKNGCEYFTIKDIGRRDDVVIKRRMITYRTSKLLSKLSEANNGCKLIFKKKGEYRIHKSLISIYTKIQNEDNVIYKSFQLINIKSVDGGLNVLVEIVNRLFLAYKEIDDSVQFHYVLSIDFESNSATLFALCTLMPSAIGSVCLDGVFSPESRVMVDTEPVSEEYLHLYLRRDYLIRQMLK